MMLLIIELLTIAVLLTSCTLKEEPDIEEAVEIMATYDYKKYSTEELALYFQDEALYDILLFYMPSNGFEDEFSTFQEFPEMCNNLSISKLDEGYEVIADSIHYIISYEVDSATNKITSFKRRFL